jgi:hypothetical protein
MGYLRYVKWGFVCVAIFEIASLFYLLHVYNQFVSNPENYYKRTLIIREQQIQDEIQKK